MNSPVSTNPASDAQARWKMIYLARRNPALAAGDFAQAWREHSALGRQCRNVQDKVLGVTQCTRLRESGDDGGIDGASTDYDGVNLLQLRDLAVATDLWNDPETLAIMLRDAPAGEVALFGFLRRGPGISKSEFDAAWAGGPLEPWLAAPALQGALRVGHNSVVQTPPVGYDYDGIAEWWFASADAARAAFGGASAGDLRGQFPAVYGAVADLARSVFMFTQVSHRRP